MVSLTDLEDTHWSGRGELWLDPAGDEATRYECTITVESRAVRYSWIHEGQLQLGVYTLLRRGGADFQDTWHAPRPMRCSTVSDGWGLLSVQGTYEAGEGPEWGWRSTLSLRPGEEDALVLQMTNVAPWGEEFRAVRMVCFRAET